MRCPCRKKSETVTYAACCEPFHTRVRIPPTALALMRSRYTAFALRKIDYLLATWHTTTRPGDFAPTAEQEWIQLKIIGSSEVGDAGIVEFDARSRWAGRLHTLHEVSHFKREHGRWFYLRGDVA